MFGKAGYDINIDRLITLENQKVEEMKRILEEIMNELSEIKHLEKNLKGLDDFIEWTLKTKKWFEEHYDAKMLKAEERPDKRSAWKHAKYRNMARLSRKTYKKLEKARKTFSELKHHEKRFFRLNQLLEETTDALLPELRTETREERAEVRA